MNWPTWMLPFIVLFFIIGWILYIPLRILVELIALVHWLLWWIKVKTR